jgi:hypothetical protein
VTIEHQSALWTTFVASVLVEPSCVKVSPLSSVGAANVPDAVTPTITALPESAGSGSGQTIVAILPGFENVGLFVAEQFATWTGFEIVCPKAAGASSSAEIPSHFFID